MDNPAIAGPFISRAEAANAVRTADLLVLTFLFLIMIGGYHVHAMLTMGDWDFWVDWKDRRMWPTVLPIMLLPGGRPIFLLGAFPAAVRRDVPTFLCVALLFGEWLDRYISFWGWTFYRINLVWPTSLVPQALFLDIVLLLSKSFIVTAIVGSMGFSLLLYPNNWVILAPYHQPTEQYGTLMSLADVIGFHNVRTSMPEYIRIIERGTMRTFGKDVVGVAAFFSGFVSIIVYFVWWYVGKMFSTTKYMKSIIVASQLQLLAGYYQIAVTQSRESFLWALVGAGIGVVFFIAATFLALRQAMQLPAEIAVISGAVIEVAAGIVLFLSAGPGFSSATSSVD